MFPKCLLKPSQRGGVRCKISRKEESKKNKDIMIFSIERNYVRTMLKAYGEIVATEILRTGCTVENWNSGNEANYGFAGVEGQAAIYSDIVEWGKTHGLAGILLF